MSDEATPRERLRDSVVALETAARLLPDRPHEAQASIRRIATTMERVARDMGDAGLLHALRGLRDDSTTALPQTVATVLGLARGALASGSEPTRTILVVDDDPVLTTALASELERAGWRPFVAGTAADALAKLQTEPVAAVLLDLILPDADGRNTLITIKEELRLALPVYVISARTDPAIAQECLALGARQYFRKPLDIRTLVGTLSPRQSVYLAGQPVVRRAQFRASFEEAAGRPRCVGLLAVRPMRHAEDVDADALIDALALGLAEHLRGRGILGRWSVRELAVLLLDMDLAVARGLAQDAGAALRSMPGDGVSLAFDAGLVGVVEGHTLDRALDEAGRFLLVAQSQPEPAVVTPDSDLTPTSRLVVLAEDDVVTAKLLLHRFRREPGLELLHVADGADALSAITERRPALAILDVQMPGMDGFSLLRAIREAPGLAQMPVMMLTSLGSEQDVVRGFSLGANDYVTKPFSPTELLARTRRLLGSGTRTS